MDPLDLRALAELVMLSMIGLAVLTVAVGFSVRVFLAPTLRDLANRLGRQPPPEQGDLATRLDRLDDRLASLEHGIERLEALQAFDRQLTGPGRAPPPRD